MIQFYVNEKYSEAYSEISGMSIKESDEPFYYQVYTVMLVDRHYEAGVSLAKADEYEDALDSLLKGIATFDKYQNVGREYGCYDDMNKVLGWIVDELNNTYGLTESKARELTLIENREEYAFIVRTLAKVARENNSEELQ